MYLVSCSFRVKNVMGHGRVFVMVDGCCRNKSLLLATCFFVDYFDSVNIDVVNVFCEVLDKGEYPYLPFKVSDVPNVVFGGTWE